MVGWIWVLGMALSTAALPAVAQHHSSHGEVKKEAGQVTHQGKGKVVAVDKAGLAVKLAHEEIKSLGWPAMTMSLKVANAALLEGLKGGDRIAFELGQGSKPGGWQITRITLD